MVKMAKINVNVRNENFRFRMLTQVWFNTRGQLHVIMSLDHFAAEARTIFVHGFLFMNGLRPHKGRSEGRKISASCVRPLHLLHKYSIKKLQWPKSVLKYTSSLYLNKHQLWHSESGECYKLQLKYDVLLENSSRGTNDNSAKILPKLCR